MISIICTSCRTELRIDEAFAGGVCRCQHCGTIQTVPTHLKDRVRPPAPGSAPASKTLYQRRANSDAGTGLDDLADAVATSSGLGSRRLQSAARTATASGGGVPPVAVKKDRPLVLLIVGAAVIAVLILLGVIWYVMHGSSTPAADSTAAPGSTPMVSPTPSNTNSPTPSNVTPPTVEASSFCGVPLEDASVVYILDRGGATAEFFDPIKAALYHSLDLLGPDRKFAVILTDNGATAFTYPASDLADATPANTRQVRSALDDLVASGASHFRWALERAVFRRPATIVLITAKWSLDPDDVEALQQNADRGIRIDTIMVGDSDATKALKDAAKQSGGQFSQVRSSDLARFGS